MNRLTIIILYVRDAFMHVSRTDREYILVFFKYFLGCWLMTSKIEFYQMARLFIYKLRPYNLGIIDETKKKLS